MAIMVSHMYLLQFILPSTVLLAHAGRIADVCAFLKEPKQHMYSTVEHRNLSRRKILGDTPVGHPDVRDVVT